MRVLFLALLLVSVVLAQQSSRPENDPTYSAEQLPEDEDPALLLQSFQGTYTSMSAYNQALYICVADDGTVQGSYDQAGIIQGTVTTNTKGISRMTGTFYEAGNYGCSSGTFSLELTTWGFTGTYTCDVSGTEFTYEEVRVNIARPSNDECSILSEDLTAEGNWEDDAALPMSICIESRDAVEISYQRNPDPSYWANTWFDGYVEGTSFLDGRVVIGTWYETQGTAYMKAGGVIYVRRDNGYLQEWKWTGLAGGEGQTALDPTQYFDESLHTVKNWRFYFGNSALADCQAYDANKGFVLLNLFDDDDDYYYFVGSDFFNSQFDPQYDLVGAEYLHPPVASDASSLVAPIVILALCLSLVFF